MGDSGCHCRRRNHRHTLGTIDTAGSNGATWGPDDTIIVATNSVDSGFLRASAAGGPLTVLTRPDRAKGQGDHSWPEMLPGGRAVLFTITSLTGGDDAAQVAVLDLQTGAHRILVSGGSHAHYVASKAGSPKRGEGERGRCVRCRSISPASKRVRRSSYGDALDDRKPRCRDHSSQPKSGPRVKFAEFGCGSLATGHRYHLPVGSNRGRSIPLAIAYNARRRV